MVARDLIAHPLQAHRIQPDQRNGEAAPEFLLELGEHALERDDQNPLAAPALDQLRGQNAGLQRLAKAHGVGDEDALAGLAQGLERGV